jgi:hypothetical protein
MEKFILYIWEDLLNGGKAYLIDLKIKLWLHCILLPYLFSFYSFFLLDALENVLEGFGFTCPYEHPFFPYFEYCFIFFIILIYVRLFINMLFIQNKAYFVYLFFYLIIFILFLIWCDWYSHYQLIWNNVDQKYMYNLNFNMFGAAFIFLFCLLSFFIFDLFIFALYVYPLVSILFFTFGIFFVIFFDIAYLEIFKAFHQIITNLILFIKNCLSAECMHSNSDLTNEKPTSPTSLPETKSEIAPKTSLQRASEYLGDYRYEQRPIECKENEVSVRYTQTPEGCRVSLIQCLPDPRISSSVDAALNNNLPTGYAARPLAEHIIGEPIRVATLPGVETSVELKETRCREISSKLFKSLEGYKKNT